MLRGCEVSSTVRWLATLEYQRPTVFLSDALLEEREADQFPIALWETDDAHQEVELGVALSTLVRQRQELSQK
jgi:hypothetical protein